MTTEEPLPPLPDLSPSLPGPPSLPGLPPLPGIGPVSRRPPADGARRRWQFARVVGLRDETAQARTFTLELPPGTPRHVPGQHYDVRLTADDGSTAQRSYSIGSAPGSPSGGTSSVDSRSGVFSVDSRSGVCSVDSRSGASSVDSRSGVRFELTVDRIPDGDVSPALHDEVEVGDELEVRGPFGGWFIWRGDTPVLLVGGGSGVVPLMSMRRHWVATDRPVPLRMVVAVRSPDDLFYTGEYGPETTITYSRRTPPGDPRPPGRLDPATLEPLLIPGATAYVCGSAGFAEAASQLLVSLGVDRTLVRVERFGPA